MQIWGGGDAEGAFPAAVPAPSYLNLPRSDIDHPSEEAAVKMTPVLAVIWQNPHETLRKPFSQAASKILTKIHERY